MEGLFVYDCEQYYFILLFFSFSFGIRLSLGCVIYVLEQLLLDPSVIWYDDETPISYPLKSWY